MEGGPSIDYFSIEEERVEDQNEQPNVNNESKRTEISDAIQNFGANDIEQFQQQVGNPLILLFE